MTELQTPNIRIRIFKSLDFALDYCKDISPKSLVIETVLDQIDEQGNQQKLWQLQYISGDNNE